MPNGKSTPADETVEDTEAHMGVRIRGNEPAEETTDDTEAHMAIGSRHRR
jgi:hypothetical protein